MRATLPRIEVVDVGVDFPMEIARSIGERSYQLREEAIGGVPAPALRVLDKLAHRWLERHRSPYLAEIENLASQSREPGLYFLNISYEWGCTTAARADPADGLPVLQRTLDWSVNGLGRHVIAAKIACTHGAWVALTWPAFTGVIQGLAPGRFAAAINQPMPQRRSGLLTVDWLLSRLAIWRSPHLQPAHLLRRVFENATDFATARDMLMKTPVAAPAIFTLAGLAPDEAVTIERQPEQARVIADAMAANEWRAADWSGRQHGSFENAARLASMREVPAQWDPTLRWVRWPILNPSTRLAMMACPAAKRLIARGYEAGEPATEVLDLQM